MCKCCWDPKTGGQYVQVLLGCKKKLRFLWGNKNFWLQDVKIFNASLFIKFLDGFQHYKSQ